MDALTSLVTQTLQDVTAPWVRALALQPLSATVDTVQLRMPVTPALVHGGGVLCGQAIMAAADTAMVLATVAALGAFRPMTTVQLQTSFLRPLAGDADALLLTGRVLRKGKSLVFGEIEMTDPEGRLVAHATTTYALL